ncbi:MAG: glycosyltransferase [Clostridia bacterium]|nr:glycosyltransferase [Clostridia bacterium]
MRIVIVNVAATCGGALSVLTDFYNDICSNPCGHQWIFIVSTPVLEETADVKVRRVPWVFRSWWHRIYWELFVASKVIDEYKPDVVLTLQSTMVLRTKIPQVVYVQQAIPFQKLQRFSFLKKKERVLAFYQYFYGYLIKRSIVNAAAVVMQSQYLKDAASDIDQKLAGKIHVIPPKVKIPEYISTDSHKPCTLNRFFYPAAYLVYKNHKCIFEAMKYLLETDKRDFSVSLTVSAGEIRNDIGKFKPDLWRNLQLTGRIKRDEVLRKYGETVLVFPSYIESFGMPLCEAMMAGTLILAADCPYAREVIGEYRNAYFFDPFDSRKLAELMLKAINGEIGRINEKTKIRKTENRSMVEVLENVAGKQSL